MIAVWVWNLDFSKGYRLLSIWYGLYAGCSYLAKRMRNKGMIQTLQDDPRPPVLYLRPFDREDEIFALLSYDEFPAARYSDPKSRGMAPSRHNGGVSCTGDQAKRGT